MSDLPIGCVVCFATPNPPKDYLPCDGRELSKRSYPELYNMIRDVWDETATTFFLPDLRGRFVRGWDDGDGVDPDSGADKIRDFGSEQEDTFQGHAHNVVITGKISESKLYYKTHEIEYGTNTISSNSKLSFKSILTPSDVEPKLRDEEVDYAMKYEKQIGSLVVGKLIGKAIGNVFRKIFNISHSHELPKIEVRDAANSTFQAVRTSVETRPKNIALMYCIKVK